MFTACDLAFVLDFRFSHPWTSGTLISQCGNVTNEIRVNDAIRINCQFHTLRELNQRHILLEDFKLPPSKSGKVYERTPEKQKHFFYEVSSLISDGVKKK
ncbi:unnamed protein product [Hymenolepis diminuta]|uniref:Uncharacterized protein n=1 Tax=Hymenolepis diminuta TaxID=6216 RepID=A0A0R3SPI9_HYMDI|nr:unnamed protein product [Hymenolepis diminuta]VUZ54331.1 unnamed protein product [Hymenolepis diminuta]